MSMVLPDRPSGLSGPEGDTEVRRDRPSGLSGPGRRSSPRLSSFDYTGPYAYLLTINTARRRNAFVDRAVVGQCETALREAADKHQRSYHDRILRVEEDLAVVSEYIWNNPVRAGIAETPDADPFNGPRRRHREDRPEGLSLRRADLKTEVGDALDRRARAPEASKG